MEIGDMTYRDEMTYREEVTYQGENTGEYKQGDEDLTLGQDSILNLKYNSSTELILEVE